MLVEFSVENYRVFRDEQVLSMVAATNSTCEKLDRLVSTGFSSAPYLHRQATVYGANGAGKTSLVSAFQFMTTFVRDSHSLSATKDIQTHPFLYNIDSRQKPSKYRLNFLLDDTLYEYSFTTTPKTVVEEYLLACPRLTGRTRQLFVRQYDQVEKKYNWNVNSRYLKGDFKTIRSFTRPNALFLSTAVYLNNDSLKKLYKWIISKPVFISDGDRNLLNYTASLLYNPKWKTKIINFLRTMDTRIVDIRVSSSASKNEILNDQSYKNYENNYIDSIKGDTEFDISFTRLNNLNKRVSIPLEEESRGTRVLFQMAGRLLRAIKKERVIIMDEINTNLHPIICEEFITKIDEAAESHKKAQLIFTTHDVTASEHKNIGNDQIWLINRNLDLSSSVYAFSDVDVPQEVPFRRSYLLGRCGGIPRIVKRGV